MHFGFGNSFVVGLRRCTTSAREEPLRGKVVSVQKDGVTAQVKVKVTIPVILTPLISKEAVEDLNIEVGDTVEAIVKATEVMIAK